MRRSSTLLVLLAAACVEQRDVPDRLPQASITYGPRIILVDETRAGAPNSAWCTRLVTIATTTTSTPTGIMSVDGKGIVFDPVNSPGDAMTPASCFVDVVPKSLPVDRVEVTNELFQLCVDSDACQKPDPSKASKGPICSDESEFDHCPVVETTQSQASTFCNWVGRRLPTGIEAIAIRQANLSAADRSDPAKITPYPTGDAAPSTCDQAILQVNSCLKPRPVDVEGTSVTGAAPMDSVMGTDVTTMTGAAIYDLMGNVSEWTADLLPLSRGPFDADLPWFCVAPLSTEAFSAANPPACPNTAQCVWGQYRPYAGARYGIWPVCIISDSGAFSGKKGALVGGSYRDEATTVDVIGTYGRRIEPEPEELPDTQRAREYGLRCVDQRASGPSEGMVPDFDNAMQLVTPPEASMQ
jgi:hypothetical protein